MTTTRLNVQNRLNLILPLKDGAAPRLGATLRELDDGSANPLREALGRLGNVHFAQFVLLERGARLGVFTIFDGDFDEYILSFTRHAGRIFNAILAHVEGAERVIPVQEHKEDFLQFIKERNEKGLGLFSAYPNQRLFDIQDALKETKR